MVPDTPEQPQTGCPSEAGRPAVLATATVPDSLDGLRQRIDQLDAEIQQLVSCRARCAQAVAAVKERERQHSSRLVSTAEVTYYRPEREAQVLRGIMARNEGPLSNEEMARLFREIMSACLALEKPMTVAFAGTRGNFAHAAALKHFGRSVVAEAHAGVDDVFREVEAGQAHYGVVPVETSREGVLGPTLDIFLRSPLRICGEVQVRTHHHLLAQDASSASSMATVYGLPWVLSGCRLWLDENLPQVRRASVSSYAEGVERVRADPTAGMLGGQQCAELFDLAVVAHNIEDFPDQTARFLITGAQDIPPSGRDKTSLLVSIRNEPGALHKLLEPLSRHGLSLTRIDSRPSPLGDRRCHFFLDVLGHERDSAFERAMTEIEQGVTDLRLLGSYPEAVL